MKLAHEVIERTHTMPRLLWIELTSRCPFDCVFCSRKSLRGPGQHMAFALYEKLTCSLIEPRIIRLNYSGESGHYPHLAKAITLAAQTGAQVELVSTIASLRVDQLESMLRAGLNRLTVSLHTLDANKFATLYRYSSLDRLLRNLEQIELFAPTLKQPFTLDLAFVAMANNVDELPAIAEFAVARGIHTLAVHPLIGRDPLPGVGQQELDEQGRFQVAFARRLVKAIATVKERSPQVRCQVSSPELWSYAMASGAAGTGSQRGTLPAGAQIVGCDQSPFDTVHVLANGDVVACEVTEKIVLGDLNHQSLADIWHGDLYRAFRRRHRRGVETACLNCDYKHIAAAQSSHRIDGKSRSPSQLLQGFFDDENAPVIWTQAQARFWLRRRFGDRKLVIRGMLPPAPPGSANALSVQIRSDKTLPDQERMGSPSVPDGMTPQAVNRTPDMMPVHLQLPLNFAHTGAIVVDLRVNASYQPYARGAGEDLRELGFALIEARCARL
jgi:radical SAM protein with 4Fe4S-binding SPASM domain